jgi:hypothetical protein
MVAESAAPVAPVALLDEPDRLRVGLSPIRRRLLERLRQPASATQLASELATSSKSASAAAVSSASSSRARRPSSSTRG